MPNVRIVSEAEQRREAQLKKLKPRQRTLFRRVESELLSRMRLSRVALFGEGGMLAREGVMLFAKRHDELMIESPWLADYFGLRHFAVDEQVAYAERLLARAPTSLFARDMFAVWSDISTKPFVAQLN